MLVVAHRTCASQFVLPRGGHCQYKIPIFASSHSTNIVKYMEQQSLGGFKYQSIEAASLNRITAWLHLIHNPACEIL